MSSSSMTFFRCAVLFSIFASALAHTSMFSPIPRTPGKDYVFSSKTQNSCENTNTAVPTDNVFTRGGQIKAGWFWNNHKGGFIKFALVKGIKGNMDNAQFLDNKNIIQGQCYTGGCAQGQKDTGNKFKCIGKPLVIPDHIADGDYVLHFSSIGGFSSSNIPTKLLPLYHNCANIRIKGGNKLVAQPKNWIAPFVGGSQDVINGKKGGNDVCGFKQFNAEPSDPKLNDVKKNEKVNDMKFGKPAGWAVAGGTLGKRIDNIRLPRLGHVARAVHARTAAVEEYYPEARDIYAREQDFEMQAREVTRREEDGDDDEDDDE